MYSIGQLHFLITREMEFCTKYPIGPSNTPPLVNRAIYSRDVCFVGWMSCFVVAGMNSVGALVGRANPQPSWLPGPASCGGCQTTGGLGMSLHGWLCGLRAARPGAAYWLMGNPPAWIGQKEESTLALVSTHSLLVEQAPSDGCCQCLCPQACHSCLLPLWVALQGQQVDPNQAHYKLLSLSWD